MAKTFKSLLGDDVVNTRTMLHEAIPITGTISSGTYIDATATETNIKTFSHGMFESVYDYPYLSSSANHIFDVTFGHSSTVSDSSKAQNSKKVNMYNQMAQVLMGYDVSGSVRAFDSDGEVATQTDDTDGRMDHCFFLNFSRLLTKDEIKKNSFRLQLHVSGVAGDAGKRWERRNLQTLGDYLSATEFRTSPAGDYGLIFTASGDTPETRGPSVGLVFYQAGVAVLTSSIFSGSAFYSPGNSPAGGNLVPPGEGYGGAGRAGGVAHRGVNVAQTGSTIEELGNAFRHRIHDIDFNNTIELNSSIYFCRVNHNEYNYSSNPTYVAGSKLVVKNNVNDLPVSYITSVGLYSPDNELLAVAKLSEPLRKDPNTELTLRVRLDY